MKLLNRKNLEIRKAYFLEAFGRTTEEMAIISFGSCNYHCPYCKRDCQFIDDQGQVINTRTLSMEELFRMIDREAIKGRRVRLSGGDPVAYPKESLQIADYVMKKYGQKISIAHNGSSYGLVKSLIENLEYIAMDFKAFYKDRLVKITGTDKPVMDQVKIIELCQEYGVIVDVRTPVFGDTTLKELREIARIISKYDNVFWTLRKYNKVQGCDFPVPEMDKVTEIAQAIKEEFPNLHIGTRNYWKGGFEIF